MDVTNVISSYAPLAIVFGVVVLGIAAARTWLDRRRKADHAHVHIRVQLLLIALSVVALIAVILALPIRESDRNSLLGIVGLMITAVIGLSATTHVGNGLAGIMIRSARRFRPGDFIESGEHFGRVTDLGLFHTEIQTETRDLTILPNVLLATSPVTVVRSSGTIATASVSIGYDVPHGEVAAALSSAAGDCGLTDPVVQVRDLGDFSVTYRVSGLLDEPRRLLSARSDLRYAMLDRLHQAAIEIVSPTFMNQRQMDADAIMIPRSQAPTTAPTGDLEALVFDKADLAESVEELNDRLGEIDGKIAELESGDGSPEAARRIESLKQSRDVVGRVIEERKKAVDEDGRR